MNKNLLFLFLLLGSSTKAQTEMYVYQNDFTDPYLFFSTQTKDDVKTFTKNGTYRIEFYDSAHSYIPTSSQMIFYNPKEDYTIETSVVLVSGGNDQKGDYGMSFGRDKNSDDGNYFVCNKNGTFSIYCIEDDKIIMITDPKKSDAIKSVGTANILKVQRTGNLFHFFINGTEVASSDKIKSYATWLGFWVSGKMTMEADYFNVLQKRKPINLIENSDKFGVKERLGPEINSNYNDKHPIISPDGLHLYVNRDDHPGNTGGPTEDIWVSEFAGGKWGELQNMSSPINNKDKNYLAGVSADNTMLLLGNVYSQDGQTLQEGYSVSYKTKNGWGKPTGIKIDNYYNKNKFNGACISADKNVLIITVERNDTYGDKDLYVCFRRADSTYTEPKNMGPVVNSWSGEFGPYLSSDGKTLYFSSFGHPGYGESDIFVAKRLDDTWTDWTVPQNLGPKINSKHWDGYISISAKADYAYISSTEGNRTDIDCYRVKIPKTDAVVLLKGKVFNDKTKDAMSASVKFIEVGTGKIIHTVDVGGETGEYSIVINKPGKYEIISAHDGFTSYKKIIEIKEIPEYSEIKQDLPLVPKEIMQCIVKGKIFNEKTKEVIGASVKIIDVFTGKIIQTIEVGNDTGRFSFIVTKPGKFEIVATHEGFTSHKHAIEIPKLDLTGKEIKVDVPLAPVVIPTAQVVVKGKVFNDKTKNPLGSSVKLVESGTGKIIQTLASGTVNGEYSFTIDKAGKYDIAAFHDGFISIHKTIEIKEIKVSSETKLDLPLTPIEAGQTIVLKNIFFTPNKFDLLSQSNEELNKLVKIMKENPKLKIEVSGHTSKNNEGEKFNEELSTNRAMAVKNYLIQNGIEDARVSYKGFGFTKPIYVDEIEEHQALNRRVEFTIVSK